MPKPKTVTPALGDNSFTCPHCGAVAHQTWYKTFLTGYDKDSSPWMPALDAIERIKADRQLNDRESLITFFENKLTRKLFRDTHEDGTYLRTELINLNISLCYSCDRYSLWIADALIHPNQTVQFDPSDEMPDDVALDFKEAASIVEKSPRGAAALLRLAIQRLMPHLKCKGKNLDDDIGELVKRGLDSRVQKALDVVRVVGNNAVHPGQIDLRDDKATAVKLFDLVDLIVEAMIATPKHIEKMYGQLPEGALKAIEKRDGGA